MKADKEVFLFTGAFVLLSASWANTTLLNVWWDVALALAGSVLAGTGLMVRKQQQQLAGDEQEQRRLQELEQTRQFFAGIEAFGQRREEQTSRHQQDLRQLIQEMQRSSDEQMKLVQDNLNEEFQKRHAGHIQAVQSAADQISSVTERYSNEAGQANSVIVVELRRTADAVADLERSLSGKADRLLDASQEGLELQEEFQQKLEIYFQNINRQYEDFNEVMQDYLLKVKHTSDDIGQYRDEMEQDLRDRLSVLLAMVEKLGEAASQLSDSKHYEREQALKVQKKLNEQLNRLSSRS